VLSDHREVAIEHLSLMNVAPPDAVVVAREAGFDAVGIRAFHPEAAADPWALTRSPAMVDETVRRLSDTGVTVLDIEALALRPGLVRGDYEAVLEIGAQLGARFLNVWSEDADLRRAADTFARLTEDAAEYGLRPVLEPIYHTANRNLDEALEVVRDSHGGGIQIDVLHFFRYGGDLDQLRAVDPDLLCYLQLDDAPVEPPDSIEGRRAESRTNRLLPGEGELPVATVVAAMPVTAALALEVPGPPNGEDPISFARRARRAVAKVLEEAETLARSSL
jgi:sugar phosphate isomerase/epimerase